MEKKVLVIGGAGMAGHVIATHLSEKTYEVSTISARNKVNKDTVLLDITDNDALMEYLNNHDFDVLVNCVGMLVKASEERKDLATYINSYFPHHLEKIYEGTSTRIIHLSTDCVFSGKNAPYYESSFTDGELFYDKSKALGEIVNEKDLTFRMSIIGPDMQKSGIGLFNWFIAQEGEIQGYTGSVWNGVTTIQLAKAIDQAIKQDLTGLYHLVPKGNVTKFDLLNLFKDVFEKNNLTIKPVEGVSHDKTLVNTRNDFNYSIPEYPEMIKEMKEWIITHPDLYPHYEEK